MRTCKTCETRYWRLHTWDECTETLRRREEQERTNAAADKFTRTVQDVFSRV